MVESSALVPPIVVLGRQDDYLYAGFTVEEVVKHACGRFSTAVPALNDVVDLFDAAGRRLELLGEDGESDAILRTGSTDHQDIRERVRRVVARKTSEGAIDPESPQDNQGLEALLRALDESVTPEELAGRLATLLREPEDPGSANRAPVSRLFRAIDNGEATHGSWLHNILCH